MGRKTVISKDMILDAAYQLLDEAGIGAVAIKSIAAKLGCSTQPISWHFGSMTELKKELLFYAGARMWGNFDKYLADMNALDAFFATGVHYISMACDHPNVFRFLSVDDPKQTIGASASAIAENSIFSQQMDEIAVDILAKEYKVPKKKIGEAVQNTVIYTHGLAVMMMWDDFRMPKETACQMIFDMGKQLLTDAGIDTRGMKMKKTILTVGDQDSASSEAGASFATASSDDSDSGAASGKASKKK
ncbi:MAG: TetR/AcrR family transcriptional regulator [Clostridiales bacterium]|nr:TetR/AcrR family transcriptional regulator [Clostridiales bacterium]